MTKQVACGLPGSYLGSLPPEPLPEVATNAGAPGTEHCILGAQTDREAIQAWLNRYRGSPNTYASYLKETDRFYRWSLLVADKPVSLVSHEDFQRYLEFLEDPQPATQWTSNRKLPRTNPLWRPFCGPLAPASVRQANLILDALFSWLVESRYLEGNPISLAPSRSRSAPKKRLQRYLPTGLVAEVHGHLTALAALPGADVSELARCRWIFSALFLTGMRISELASTNMSDVRFETREGTTLWWVDVIGKGSKPRSIPLTPEFLQELRRYREDLGLPPAIGAGERTPLVVSLQALRGRTRLTRSTLHRIVKRVSLAIAEYLTHNDRGDEAAKFAGISAHWLRHSYGTAMADAHADLRSIQLNLGHSSIQSTTIYLHTEDAMRHADTQGLRLSRRKDPPAEGA